MGEALLETNLSGLELIGRGKVRDIYAAGEGLLIVSSDRISAYDVVMPNGIPDKGKLLTGISVFWFENLAAVAANHLIASDIEGMPEETAPHADVLRGRTMYVRKAEVVPVECIVRGYITGSGWEQYVESGSVCGIELPEGLSESEQLPEPIFTPTTKATSGHDMPVTFEEMVSMVGKETAESLRDHSVDVYRKAAEYATERGIIIADTKFEWGRDASGDLILVDEVFTPDSSRFWPVEGYEPGHGQPSYDKQFVRDYLRSTGWDKTPPAPQLPDEIVFKTREKYIKAYRSLVGREPVL